MMTDGNLCKRGACYKVAHLHPDLTPNRPDQFKSTNLTLTLNPGNFPHQQTSYQKFSKINFIAMIMNPVPA